MADFLIDTASDLLNAALGYSDLGWKIFPLRPKTKIPFEGSRGVLDATSDPDVIRRWWMEEPTANIGLALGEPSGVDALDVDPRHGGDDGFDDLTAGHQLPDTPESETGGGGRHFFFAHDPLASNNPTLAPGVEFRSTGYYVVLPPSIHPSGRAYEWDGLFGIDDVRPAVLPSFILDQVRSASTGLQPPTNGSTTPKRLERPIPEGQRNNTLTSILGGLRRDGAPREALLAVAYALRDKWMSESADPSNRMTDREVEGIVDRIAAHAPDLFNYAYQEQVRQLLVDKQPSPDNEGEDEEGEIEAVTWDGLVAMSEPAEWLVDGIIPFPGVTMLQGDPGIGKTWLGLSIMLAVARGSKWLQQFYVKEGPVLAILGEEWPGAVKERMELLARASGALSMMDQQPIHYVMRQEVLLHKEDSREMNPRLHRLIEKLQPKLIVFDPFLLMHLAEENDNTAMRGVMRLLDDCSKIPAAGASVLVCHHVNKPKDREFASIQYRARGASAIVGHVDSILDVQGNFGHQVVNHAKSKRGPVVPRWIVTTDYSKMNQTMTLKYKKAEEAEREKEDKAEKTLMEILQEAVEPLSKGRIEEIAQKRGSTQKRTRELLNQFIDDGVIEPDGENHGHPRWKLVVDPAPPTTELSDRVNIVEPEPLLI